MLLAGSLLLTIAIQAQNLKKDSLKVQKILKGVNKGKTAPYLATITDKKQVAFISGYIDAKTAEKKKADDAALVAYNATLGMRYANGDKSVIPQVIKVLQGGDSEKIRELFGQMEPEYDSQDKLVLDPAVKTEIIKLLENEELEGAAIQLLSTNEIEGWQQILEDRLLSGKSSEELRIYYRLSTVGSAKAFDYYDKNHGNDSYMFIKELPWDSFDLRQYFEKGPGHVKTRILDNAYKVLRDNPFTEEELSASVAVDSAVVEYEEYPEKTELAQTEEEIEEAVEAAVESVDEVYYETSSYDEELSPFDVKSIALDLVVEFGDERTVPAYTQYSEMLQKVSAASDTKDLGNSMDIMLLKYYPLQKKKETVMRLARRSEDQFSALCRAVYADPVLAADPDVNAAIFAEYERPKLLNYDTEEFISHFHRMDKATFGKLVDTHIKAPFKREKLKTQYAFSYQTLEETNKYLLENGFVPEPIVITDINGTPARDYWDKGENPMMTSLELSGITVFFDSESGAYPADYDNLLDAFAKISKGKLQGCKRYLQYKIEEDEEGYYTSESYFLVAYKNKVYVMAPGDSGEWYEMGVFQELLDALAADTGVVERYVPFGYDGQMGLYIFAEPAKAQKLIKEYDLNKNAVDIGE